MPTDHRVSDDAAFRAAVKAAAQAVGGGAVALFGIKPTAPATGYGYIRMGKKLPGSTGAMQVASFVEKPASSVAHDYIESGEYLWNSGIFLLPAKVLLEELARHVPEVLRQAERALEGAARQGKFVRLEEAAFARCPSISIDHAVMERTERAVVIPGDFGWADVGTWSALWDAAERDEAGNTRVGDVLMEDTRDSYLRSEGPLIATLGVEGLIVVATPDAILVADRRRDQDIRKIVDRLKAQKRDLT
jgi:mannose-1-phosphate guanylyltransferase/mannose-1-phosphate guanylyltransferase/mannose-6-phosphate isomerase